MSGFLPGSASSTAEARTPAGKAAGSSSAPALANPAPSAAPAPAPSSRRRRVNMSSSLASDGLFSRAADYLLIFTVGKERTFVFQVLFWLVIPLLRVRTTLSFARTHAPDDFCGSLRGCAHGLFAG